MTHIIPATSPLDHGLLAAPDAPRSTGEDLRAMMGNWTTGVAIITAQDAAGRPIGLACNSFTSVSLEPPLVSWCIDGGSRAFEAWTTCESFSVHILAESDLDLVSRFAARGTDKFAGLAHAPSALGTPAIAGVQTRLDCRAWARYAGGDHTILLGEVLTHSHGGPVSGLTNLALRRG